MTATPAISTPGPRATSAATAEGPAVSPSRATNRRQPKVPCQSNGLVWYPPYERMARIVPARQQPADQNAAAAAQREQSSTHPLSGSMLQQRAAE